MLCSRMFFGNPLRLFGFVPASVLFSLALAPTGADPQSRRMSSRGRRGKSSAHRIFWFRDRGALFASRMPLRGIWSWCPKPCSMSTCAESVRNSRRISTSNSRYLKLFRMNTCEKYRGGATHKRLIVAAAFRRATVTTRKNGGT